MQVLSISCMVLSLLYLYTLILTLTSDPAVMFELKGLKALGVQVHLATEDPEASS